MKAPILPPYSRRGSRSRAVGNRTAETTSSLPERVRSVVSGSGEPLPLGTQKILATRLGHDFSTIRIHADDRAAESAKGLHAEAYAVGNHLAFARGRYEPRTGEGLKLLAHEVTHSLQGPARSGFSRTNDASEREADRVSERVSRGETAPEVRESAPALSRRSKAGTTGHLVSRGFTDWSYVVYDQEIKLRFYDKGPPGKPATQVGTIPWISNNPGNMTVDPASEGGPYEAVTPECKAAGLAALAAKEVKLQSEGKLKKGTHLSPPSGDSQQALPLKQGAIGLYGCRYAIFKTVADGYDALLPYLQGFATRTKNPDMTVADALKAFKGQEPGEGPEVKEKYLSDIRDFMLKALSLSGVAEGDKPGIPQLKEAAAKTRELLSKRVLAVTGTDPAMGAALGGLWKNEGLAAMPGVTFRCAGFEGNVRELYGKHEWDLMEALKGSADVLAELKALLGCT